MFFYAGGFITNPIRMNATLIINYCMSLHRHLHASDYRSNAGNTHGLMSNVTTLTAIVYDQVHSYTPAHTHTYTNTRTPA